MLASSENEIGQHRVAMTELVKYMCSLSYQDEQIGFFGKLRSLKPETLKAADCFMVTEDLVSAQIPEEYHHDSFGFIQNTRLIYSGRFVLPIKDVTGKVAGFTGYDKFEEPKYLDSRNYGYKAKEAMLFGMEQIYDYDYVVVPEGPMCALYLREQGINARALLGSYMSPYVIEILKRFGERCLVIPDADSAGLKLKKQVQATLPKAFVMQSKVAKDVDDSRKVVGDDVATEILNKINNPFIQLKYFV